jgi:hypothetical protein
MKRYRYVVVCSNGGSHDLARDTTFYPFGLGAVVRYDLPELLRRGWLPVRETPMGATGDTAGHAFALVLLEKEVEEPPTVEAVPE